MKTSSRDYAISIAREELQRRGIDIAAYVLDRCCLLAGSEHEWEINFVQPDVEDGRIRMVVDTQAGAVKEFRGSWA